MADMLTVLQPPRRRGRPRSTVPKSYLTVYVPTSYQDRLNQLALKHDVSVSKVLCKVLDTALSMPRNK